MKFEVKLAFRHLTASLGQTLLIMGGVAMAVTLVVFVTSLIYGVQREIVGETTGSIPLVTVEMPKLEARPPDELPQASPDTILSTERRKRPVARDTIGNWRYLEAEMLSLPQVRAVSPGVKGQALALHGGRESSVQIVGADPAKEDQIVHLQDDVVQGTYLALGAQEITLGVKLADELGVALGDRVRLVSGTGFAETYRVAGIVDSGQPTVDSRTVYTTLRAAQALLQTGRDVTSFSLTLDDLFGANRVADLIEASLGLEAKSWMRENPDILNALRAQSGSSFMISAFSLIAAGFAISSVLIVSVVKRSPEIGILKSMGARRAQVVRVFIFEAIGIGVVGSLLGALAGSGLALSLRNVRQPPRVPGRVPDPLFPIEIDLQIVALTVLAVIVIAVIASVLPARQAATMDPVEVLRRG